MIEYTMEYVSPSVLLKIIISLIKKCYKIYFFIFHSMQSVKRDNKNSFANWILKYRYLRLLKIQENWINSAKNAEMYFHLTGYNLINSKRFDVLDILATSRFMFTIDLCKMENLLLHFLNENKKSNFKKYLLGSTKIVLSSYINNSSSQIHKCKFKIKDC